MERVGSSTAQTMKNLIIVLWLVAMSFAFWICYITNQAHNQTPRWLLSRRYKRGIKYPKGYRKTYRKKSLHIPKSSKDWQEILLLLRYDEATARRLFEYVKDSNPGKSDQWVLEKALWDLQRDRQ